MALLQPEPWKDDGDDASYDETLQLYLRAAECHLYMNQHTSANSVLSTIFSCANGPLDKAPAWVLQSRIDAQSGDALKALACLEGCLRDMGVLGLEENASFDKCDQEFERLSLKIQGMDRSDILNPPGSSDPGAS